MMDSCTQAVLTAEAYKLVGAHYLTGGYGATPGGNDGAPFRRNMVSLAPVSFNPRKPCIHAAETDLQVGENTKDKKAPHIHSVCGGRWMMAKWGRVTQPSNWELLEYLKLQEAKYKQTSLIDADPMGLTPRLVILKDAAGDVVWGEDCRGKRHFDCVGLVNYLLTLVCDRSHGGREGPGGNKGHGGLERSFSHDVLGHKANTDEVPRNDPPVGGDILYKKTSVDHIGLLLMDGNVIQAAEPGVGVTTSPYQGTSWDYRGRHNDRKFLSLSCPREREPIVTQSRLYSAT
ncbi:MAG: C40 family peptidase [Acidobacteria bacterium]|nr:C40 family peptidase [Acidobacteriota bacterium]